MTYQDIDLYITAWAERHFLKLNTSWNKRPARFAYVSSEAGECFQISIDAPLNGYTSIWASCVEGRREDHPPEEWRYPTGEVGEALEEVFQTVTAWMRPSVRYLPPSLV
jgi:hypothetical protein